MAMRDTDRWGNLSVNEKTALIAVLGLLVLTGIAVVLAVEVESTFRGGFVPRLGSLLFNFEDHRTHIVSHPLLWVARGLLLGVVGCIVWSTRSRTARLASRDWKLE